MNAAAAATRPAVPSPASCRRSPSGAVMIRSRSWLPAWVRALTAPRRAARSTRIDSAAPSPALRRAGLLAVERGDRGRDRIDRVGLAAAPAALPVRAVHLLPPPRPARPGSGPARRRSCRSPPLPQPASSPCPRSHASNAAYPAPSAGNDSVPSTRPTWLVTAATCALGVGVHAAEDNTFAICDPGHTLLLSVPAIAEREGTAWTGTSGQDTSKTPQGVRLLSGHGRPGQAGGHLLAASPGRQFAAKDTRQARSATFRARPGTSSRTRPASRGGCGSPEDNPVDIPRQGPRSNQSWRKCYARLGRRSDCL